MADVVLKIDEVTKSFGADQILSGVSLELKRGTIASLLGPSGCGKTTLLRAIAGFEKLDSGFIAINGQLVNSKDLTVPPEKRRIGLVFQDYALFPHLNVSDNIAFGLDHLDKFERRNRVERILNSVNLQDSQHRLPHELSGGQRQRVALGRALAPEPDILLLDEPFSNLDPKLRVRMKRELKELLCRFGVTALLVTHNQDEAFDIADEIGILHQGRILQWGNPYDLYHRPRNRIVAEFLGMSSFLPARLNGRNKLDTELGELPCDCFIDEARKQDLTVLLRPDDIVHDDHVAPNAVVEEVAFRGMYQIYSLKLPSGTRIYCFTSSHHERHEVGTKIGVRLDMAHTIVLDD